MSVKGVFQSLIENSQRGLDSSLKIIIEGLDNIGEDYQIIQGRIFIKGTNLARTKTKINRGLKERGVKIHKSKGYHGEYDFKFDGRGGSTFGGFDIQVSTDRPGHIVIYTRGGTGYSGID